MTQHPRAKHRLLRLFPVLLLGLLALPACGPRAVVGPTGDNEEPKTTDERPDPNAVQLRFLYGSEKEEWIKDVTEAFNRSGAKVGGKAVTVKATPEGSGECIDDVLSERVKADLLSPASGAFILLGNAQSKEKVGSELIGPTKNLVLSPVVIAMWKPMAEALGWPDKPVGWSDILAMAAAKDGWASKGRPQWGSFKFGHTHPEHSNSGLISVLAEMYAAAGKTDDLTVADVSGPKTADFVRSVEHSVVHYGSSTGFFGKKMFANGPQYLSAAVLYESMVIESYGDKYKDLPFPVVAIYPKEGTFWSDHPVGIVRRDWVTEERREAAQLYIDYLLEKEQQEKALKYGFRPGLENVPLGPPIDADHGANPREPKLVLEPPPVEVMQASLKAWRQNKKHSRIVLVFDRSGSMNDQDKLTNAKKGAKEIVSMLGDEDRLGLLAFSSTSAWVEKEVRMKDGRDRLNKAIDELFAGGQTALYDTIQQAHDHLEAAPEPDVISAIVVLTDGEDNKSRLSLNQLTDHIKVDNERRTTRVFTIAYGADASEKVLQAIADATQAKSYKGTPETIRAVFQDIATFF